MAGVSRAGRAAARSHTQAAGKGLGWKERAVGGLPAPGVATVMVHTHLQGPSLQVLGVVLVLRGGVSRVGVSTHTATPVPIRVTWCQSWEVETATCPLLTISAAVQNQACFDLAFLSFSCWTSSSGVQSTP